MNIDPRHLLQIAAIADCGTFSAAAAQLGTSQPALSRVVSQLERRLGTPLFDRASRPPAPTEAGRALVDQGRAIRAASDQASLAIERITKGEFGSIRMGAPPFLCDHVLSDIIAEFLKMHPRIRIEMVPEFFPVLQSRLLADDIDLVVGPITLVDRTLPLVVERLLEDSNVVVCRAGHPLARRRHIRPEDLESSAWISHSASSTLHADMQAALTSAGVNRIDISFESASAGAVLKVLEGSDCLTMLPHNVASRLVRDGRVCILPIPDRSPSRPIGLVRHAHRSPAVAIPVLTEFLRKKLAIPPRPKPKRREAQRA